MRLLWLLGTSKNNAPFSCRTFHVKLQTGIGFWSTVFEVNEKSMSDEKKISHSKLFWMKNKSVKAGEG